MGNSPSKSSQGDSTSLINLCLKDERGVAFIVSNRASEDDKNMEELFKEVKFDVHVRNNVTAKQFLATCEYLARYEEYPSTCKMIVIYFSGHGSNGFISMKPEKDHDGRIHVLDLRAMFKNTNIAKVVQTQIMAIPLRLVLPQILNVQVDLILLAIILKV